MPYSAGIYEFACSMKQSARGQYIGTHFLLRYCRFHSILFSHLGQLCAHKSQQRILEDNKESQLLRKELKYSSVWISCICHFNLNHVSLRLSDTPPNVSLLCIFFFLYENNSWVSRGWGDLKYIHRREDHLGWLSFQSPSSVPAVYKVIPPPGRPLIWPSPSCFIMWIHNILRVTCIKTATSSWFSNRPSPLMLPLLAFFPLPHAEQEEASLPNLFLGRYKT